MLIFKTIVRPYTQLYIVTLVKLQQSEKILLRMIATGTTLQKSRTRFIQDANIYISTVESYITQRLVKYYDSAIIFSRQSSDAHFLASFTHHTLYKTIHRPSTSMTTCTTPCFTYKEFMLFFFYFCQSKRDDEVLVRPKIIDFNYSTSFITFKQCKKFIELITDEALFIDL